MATLVVFNKNNTHLDPDKERQGSWKKGYVINVLPDGSTPEAPAERSKVWFIHIPGVSVTAVKKYADPEMSGDTLYRRRQYQILWEFIPPGVKNQLLTNREYTVTDVKKAKQWIKNHTTGLMEELSVLCSGVSSAEAFGTTTVTQT